MRGMAPRVMLSSTQRDAAPDALLAALRARFPAATLEYLPGALKFCRLAEGLADVYPRTLPSCGWDSAAGQALLEAAGGAVLDSTGRTLAYRASPGWRNGSFVAVADAGYAWGRVFGWSAGVQEPDRTADSPPMNS
jgi:3'(2'), 5'-bisphosphate nucleotidase